MSALSTVVRIRHVHGYLALGMLAQARAELALISPGDLERADVMEAHVQLQMAAKRWKKVVASSAALARRHPALESGWIHWAYALRELQHIADARAVLLEGESLHGKTSALLHYNLACYYCLLGEPEIARDRLRRACGMDAQFKSVAQTDPDLAALQT